MATTVTKAALRERFVGKTLHQVPTPSVVLDIAKLEANCKRMIQAAAKLDIRWRAHIKTHKTVELTRLQVGEDAQLPANIIVSTLLEAEKITPLLQEYLKQGRQANVLYAFPLYPSCVDRLAKVSADLGPRGLSVMVDHPQQVPLLAKLATKAGHLPHVFVKIDMGYRRAGVIPESSVCAELVKAVLAEETRGSCTLLGLYAHAGQSYHDREDWRSLGWLDVEFRTLQSVARTVRDASPGHKLVLSVGATPTATSLQHPDLGGSTEREGKTDAATAATVSTTIHALRQDGFDIEVHAGVYPMLDLQQLATHACDGSLLTCADIGISVLAEVASLYSGRGANGTTEALINAGCLALGREPCADEGSEPGVHYNGWGIVMPWGVDNVVPGPGFPAVHGGWQVGRISQEHGILVWGGGKDDEVPLRFGQRVRVWPNHACVAGAGFDYYLVVDSRRHGKEDEVVDVWPRWNGR